jgi:hypothetical protein
MSHYLDTLHHPNLKHAINNNVDIVSNLFEFLL